jgi:membrane-associated protein
MYLRQGTPKKAYELIAKYGSLSLVIICFIPAVNPPPFVAGLNRMKYREYIMYNLTGAIIWCVVVLAVGYLVGQVSFVSQYLDLIFDLVIAALVIILVYSVFLLIRGYWPKKPHVP